jgi:hypothetical protein
MIEFESLCYLQNQKTGCTFVETFLREFCSEGIVRYEKHRAAPRHKSGKFYFVSVREPLDAYLSLYNYGLDGKGELFGRLRAAGRGDLYAKGIAGFGDWLDFVLDAANASLIYPQRGVPLARDLGLMSFRFLRLAALGFEEAGAALQDKAAIRAFAERERLVDAVIRYESMVPELQQLVSGPLRHAFADLPAALAWLERTPPINPSKRRDAQEALALPEDLHKKLREREWYLYATHYAPAALTPQSRKDDHGR